MDDLISRSALVAELQAFKMSMGDVILGFVVDRVIERVKDQSAAVTSCQNCEYYREPEEGDFLGVCRGGVAVSNMAETYPEPDYFCPYGKRRT